METYILAPDGKTAIPVARDDYLKRMENRVQVVDGDKLISDSWRVARTELANNVAVSTVFLGMNHSFMGGPPVLWETLVFNGDHDGLMDRYTSYDAAVRGHEAIVRFLKGEGPDPTADDGSAVLGERRDEGTNQSEG